MNEKYDIDLDFEDGEALEDVAMGDLPQKERKGKRKPEPYAHAVRAVVFGSLSVVLPLFAFLFSLFKSVFIPPIVAVGGLALAIIALVSIKKCGRLTRGSLSEGLVRTGRIVAVIGLVLSALVFLYSVVVLLLAVMLAVFAVCFYILFYIATILSRIFA